jgi:hypothetical protein
LSAPFSPIALRRRSALERRALAMIRGSGHSEDAAVSEASRLATKSQELFFSELRRVAACHGITVQAPGSRFVSDGEIILLGWIAREQRVIRQIDFVPNDPLLIAAVARCAGLLDALGIHLGTNTLYGERWRRHAPGPDRPS